jgi:hypothetical protein
MRNKTLENMLWATDEFRQQIEKLSKLANAFFSCGERIFNCSNYKENVNIVKKKLFLETRGIFLPRNWYLFAQRPKY